MALSFPKIATALRGFATEGKELGKLAPSGVDSAGAGAVNLGSKILSKIRLNPVKSTVIAGGAYGLHRMTRHSPASDPAPVIPAELRQAQDQLDASQAAINQATLQTAIAPATLQLPETPVAANSNIPATQMAANPDISYAGKGLAAPGQAQQAGRSA